MRAIVATIIFPAIRDRDEIIIRKPHELRVQSSFRTLTDTATITLARNVKYFNKNKVREVFRAGDPVQIYMGYVRDYISEFEGYVSTVGDDIPVTIQLQDEMWKLKQMPVHISLPNVKLNEFIELICPGYEVEADTFSIGSVRFVHSTVSQVLEQLQQQYGLYSYMQGKKLVVGKYYAANSDLPPVPIHLEDDVATNNLVFRHAEDLRIEIRAVSTLSNGEKIEVTVGDAGGEVRQLTYYNITDRSSLEKLAEADYEKYKVDHFSGSISIYGRPVLRHGMKVDLISRLYPERNGIYYVDATDAGIYSNAQYRRTLTLGDKVTA